MSHENLLFGRRKHDTVAAEIQEFVHDELMAHEAREKEFTKEHVAAVLGIFLKAFPNGEDGIEGHREHHAALMASAKAEKEYWELAKAELLKHGISAVLTVAKGVVLLMVAGLLLKLGFGEQAVKVLGK